MQHQVLASALKKKRLEVVQEELKLAIAGLLLQPRLNWHQGNRLFQSRQEQAPAVEPAVVESNSARSLSPATLASIKKVTIELYLLIAS